MARSTPAQTNFNGGAISKRLRGRHDLSIYDIALSECVGFAPLVEGGLDACPGFLHVAIARGPCRLVPFSYSSTQSYLVEMSDAKARFYTNDARIEDGGGDPVELALPYSLADIQALNWHQSFDVLYLFHGSYQTRLLARDGADSFSLDLLELRNGPFDKRNLDESLTVTASGVAGAITIESSAAIFVATDVGRLLQIEADDFGDISSWEPGITVVLGQLLTWAERVYRVAGGSMRTGTAAPVHAEGVEWDGIGQGTDVNGEPAGGVQLEFVCDRLGIVRITDFTDDSHVDATVLRRLPFTAASSYEYEGGYWDEWGNYIPPPDSVAYQYGSWRWRLGSFSDTSGWPTCGAIWNGRLVLAMRNRVFGTVFGDLDNFAELNEEGDRAIDMAFIETIDDPNPIVGMIVSDKLLLLTASGMHALGPNNAAQGVGPGNLRADRQNDEGAHAVMPCALDGRSIYIGASRRKVIEADFSADRNRQAQLDLSRYARHMAGDGRLFSALAFQRDPNHLVWALRSDGTLASAVYLPDEQALGWWERPLAPGVLATSLCGSLDPAGELGQIWVAASYKGATHVLRLDQWRQESDLVAPVMSDLSVDYDGVPALSFGPVSWLAGELVDVQADRRVYRGMLMDGTGSLVLEEPAARVAIGLAFDAHFTTLPISSGGENGPARDKMKRISRVSLDVLDALGLSVRAEGGAEIPLEQMEGGSIVGDGFDPVSGIVIAEDVGDYSREATITMRRTVPAAATVRAVQPAVQAAQA